MSDRRADRIVAACTLLLAAVYLCATAALPTMDIGDPLGPKAFPVLLGILLALAGILLLFESRSARSVGPGVGPGAGPGGGPGVDPGVVPGVVPRDESGTPPARPGQVAVVAAITIAFFALLEPLGYLIAFSLYLFVLMLRLHRRSPLVCLTIAVLFALGSYTLFAKALGVSLAKGLLYF